MTFIHQTAINVLEFPYAIKRSELVNSKEGQISRFTSDDCCQSQTVQFYFRTRTHGKKMRREKEKKNQWQRSDYRLWLFFYDSKRWNRDQKCFSMRIRSFLWQASNVVGFLRHSFDVWWSMSSSSSSLPSISLIHVIFIAHHSPSQIGSYSISIFQPSSDTSCCVAISITLEIV